MSDKREKKKTAPAQSRAWILTVKRDGCDRKQLEEALAGYTYVGQLEEGGETGYQHWQILRECPVVCVRGFGLQVVREPVRVGHG